MNIERVQSSIRKPSGKARKFCVVILLFNNTLLMNIKYGICNGLKEFKDRL